MNPKQHHISQLVASSIKVNKNPNTVGYADYIFRVSAAYFCSERRTARKYLDTLIQSWRFDRWRSLVAQTEFLTEKEKQEWIDKLSHGI